MAATITEIADEMVTAINAAAIVPGGEAQPIVAVRAVQPTYTIEELETYRVTVAVSDDQLASMTRRKMRREVEVDVAIHKHWNPTDTPPTPTLRFDRFNALADAIKDLFANRRTPLPISGVGMLSVSRPALYDAEKLRTQNVLLTVITVLWHAKT